MIKRYFVSAIFVRHPIKTGVITGNGSHQEAAQMCKTAVSDYPAKPLGFIIKDEKNKIFAFRNAKNGLVLCSTSELTTFINKNKNDRYNRNIKNYPKG